MARMQSALLVAAVGWALLFVVVWHPPFDQAVDSAVARAEASTPAPIAQIAGGAQSLAEEPGGSGSETTRRVVTKAPLARPANDDGETRRLAAEPAYEDWGYEVYEGVSTAEASEKPPGLLAAARTECEAQAECRRLGCSFVWDDERVVWAGERASLSRGAGRYFKLKRRDVDPVAAFEARRLAQTSSTAMAVGKVVGWSPLGGRPMALMSASVGGAVFEARALSHEAWVEANRLVASVEGLCEGLKQCAARADCAAASYRVRDGIARLYASAKVNNFDAAAKKAKDRRLQWFYVKQAAATARRNVWPEVERLVLNPWPLAEAPPVSRVVVSLTTLPDRLPSLEPTLRSLLDQQTRPADEVRLNLPRVSTRTKRAYDRPPWLAALQAADGRFVVHETRDFGPATKLVPTVRAYQGRSDVLVVVVDDDTLYPPRLVEMLARWAQTIGGAVAASGWPVLPDLLYPHWTENYLVYGTELVAPHPVAVIRGNCGFAIRPSYFTDALWTEMPAAPPGAVFMDDVWISGHLARRRVPRFVVPLDERQFNRDPKLAVTPLDSNLGGRSLDRAAANRAALAYFRPHWDVYWAPRRGRAVWDANQATTPR